MLKQMAKTAAMEATGNLGESRLFLIGYLMRFLRVMALLAIWRMVLGGRGAVSGMTLSATLTYTLVSEAFSELLTCRTGLEWGFWDGSVVMRYLRPMGLFSQITAEMLGPATVGLVLFSLPLLLAAPLLGVNPLPASWMAGELFLVSLALAVSVGLALEYLLSGLAIGLELHPYAFNSVRAAIGTVLSGAILPLAFLPWGLGAVFAWLPFASQASAPLRIYTGTGSAPALLAGQVAWSLLLWPAAGWIWRRNRERMVMYGG
ncbi:MAG TPA: ABC-2 family transporter protein [Chthonomonadaceae bacterium]|nr:ABC-2 family transporter protein [Chthonomonadaceae bacterium]